MGEKIEVNYASLENFGALFRSSAEAVQKMTEGIQSRVNGLHNTWSGRGAQAFFQEMDGEVMPALKRLHQSLDQASQVLKYTIQTFETAEEDAKSAIGQE